MATAQMESTQQGFADNGGSLLDKVIAQGVNKEALMQMKMEHESVMAECRARPRNFAAIIAELEERFRACPELARVAIYSKPVGAVFEIVCECGCRYEVGVNYQGYNRSPKHEECDKCGKWAPKSSRELKKKARNLSVRMAEELAELYGFNRVHSGLSVMDATHVKLTASFFDYQKLRSWIAESIVSRTYTGKNKQVNVIPEDRFFGVVVKAEASKCIREAILRSMPAGLKARAFAIAERIAAESLRDEDIDKIVAAFEGKGVNLARLESHVGRTRKEGWTKGDRLNLLEDWNAIEQNEATIAELFGDDAPQAKRAASNAAARVTMDDLVGKQRATAADEKSKEPELSPKNDAALQGYLDQLSKCTAVNEVNKIRKEAEADDLLAQDAKNQVDLNATIAIEQIRECRGERALRKGDGGLFDKGDRR